MAFDSAPVRCYGGVHLFWTKLTTMAKKKKRSISVGLSGFSLGRSGFAKISAVEGIVLSQEMQHAFVEFDLKGLSQAERRLAIISKYGKRSA